ncbi:MAG: beta-glucosidase [Verrucomicrobia bacterium]|nr:beta-glucosidase [Verrucomicrobiota bacterium]
MATNSRSFPPRFVWGVAAAAPQIEGAVNVAGKGESIWDRLALRPGAIHGGDSLAPACDHYRLFKKDFALMRWLGVKNYRLSLAWPRIYPQGDGPLNRKGLDFYHRLFDSMAENGITPWVTMFHWDLPQSLEDRGGWTDRVTVDAFARYADTIVSEFSGQVKNWITLNEIRCFTQLAYGPTGRKAPARAVSPQLLNQTYHHAILAHGQGVRAVREHGGKGARVGLTDNSDICTPLFENAADIAAARQWFRRRNEHILGAIADGRYSAAYLRRCGTDRPVVAKGDFDIISLPTDFLGLNIYAGTFVRAGRDGSPEEVAINATYPKADSSWLHWHPQCLYWGPKLAAEIYGHKTLYITENGCGYNDDTPNDQGEVLDLHRREFTRAYLRELHRGIGDGVPVKGYFHWSFMDNFEWEDGYTRRFGLTHVDYKTQKRTTKLSAHYYSEIIRANRIF